MVPGFCAEGNREVRGLSKGSVNEEMKCFFGPLKQKGRRGFLSGQDHSSNAQRVQQRHAVSSLSEKLILQDQQPMPLIVLK